MRRLRLLDGGWWITDEAKVRRKSSKSLCFGGLTGKVAGGTMGGLFEPGCSVEEGNGTKRKYKQRPMDG